MKLLISIVGSVLILAGVFLLGGLARLLLNYPSDFAVVAGVLAIVVGTFAGFYALRTVVYWGIIPLLTKEHKQ